MNCYFKKIISNYGVPGFKWFAPFLLLSLASPTIYSQSLEKYDLVDLRLSRDQPAVQFRLALDRVGVLLRRRIDDDAVAKLGSAFGITFSQVHPGVIHIFKLPAPKTRKELAKFALKIQQASKEIRHAGMVLYTKEGDIPIVITDEMVVRFHKSTSATEIEENPALQSQFESVAQNPLLKDLWLLRLKDNSDLDILEASDFAIPSRKVAFARPNIYLAKEHRQTLSDHQWHHKNTNQGGGTVDADIDTNLAWELTEGEPDVTIAVIDQSFDIGHPDIAANLWVNTDEPSGDGNDDDANGYVDDINGYNFIGCTDPDEATCGTGVISAADDTNQIDNSSNHHGTAVAGLTAGSNDNNAAGDNNSVEYFSGVCPSCKMILIQSYIGSDPEHEMGGPGPDGSFADSLAISYAGLVGARVVTSSWGYLAGPGSGLSHIEEVKAAIDAIAQSAVVFWAMSNEKQNDCDLLDISANENVIAISAISNQEKKVIASGFGNCMELLAPSYMGYGFFEHTGTLNIATTDRTGPSPDISILDIGYNDRYPLFERTDVPDDYCTMDINNRAYTICFGGTSASTPIAAGVGGLILSVDSSLTPEQVRRLLQDTADKVQDSDLDLTDAVYTGANYSKKTGISETPDGMLADGTPKYLSTYGYGRVNAYEAVHVVAPKNSKDNSGLGGTDIFLRDNRLDWGNTKQLETSDGTSSSGSNVLMDTVRGFIPHYQSVDIKVDAPNLLGNYRSSPTSLTFDDFTHENPVSGAVNKVYVRVHNRGPNPAKNVTVKLHWTMAGTALPDLPNDFWDVWPADTPDQSTWRSLGSREISMVRYSGASVAATSADESQIVSFDFTGPPLNPALPAFRHHCLFAVIDSSDDPVQETRLVPDVVTPTNNNVTHRNMAVQDAAADVPSFGLMVRNPFPTAIKTRLKLIKPKHWKVSLSQHGNGRPFEIGAGKEIPVKVKVVPDAENPYGDVEIRQEVIFKEKFQPFGGFIYRFPKKKE